MEHMIRKSYIRKSSSLDSLNTQLNAQGSILTSTKNQEGLPKSSDLNRRKARIPTPNRPNTFQISDATQTNEEEDDHLSSQQQLIGTHPPPITDQLNSQISDNRINNEACTSNRYSDNSIPMDKQTGCSSEPIKLNQPLIDSNGDTQSQVNLNDYDEHFDTFILHHFTTFSGKQNVIDWLAETESKFNKLKIPRQSRFDAISLLLEGEAKLRYIIHRKNIQNFDDFYEFLISRYAIDLIQLNPSQSRHTMTNSFFTEQLPSNHKFVNKQNQTVQDDSDNVPPRNKSPVITQNTVVDFGTTDITDSVPDMKSTILMSNLSTKIIDQTANDLRKAIVGDLIKNPKIFRGAKDDVQKWLEDFEHLVEIADIPECTRLSLIAYSLRGDALQWYKNNKNLFISWKIFVNEIKRAFTSSFHAELAFQKLEAYSQGENQSIRNFYNEVLKLCKEADSQMSDSTKLKNLLNKAKPSIQLEVRKKKPTSLAEFLEYAKDAEELFQLSSININNTKDNNSTNTSERSLSNSNSSFTTTNSQFNNRFSSKNPSNFSRNFNNNNNISNNLSQDRNNRYNNQQASNFSPTFARNPESSSNRSRNYNSRFPANRNNIYNRTHDNGRIATQSNSSYFGYNNPSRTHTANTISPLVSSQDQELESEQDPSSTMLCTHCQQYGHELNSCQNF